MAKIIITENMFRALSAKYVLEEMNENWTAGSYDKIYNSIANSLLGQNGRRNANQNKQSSVGTNPNSSSPGTPANGVDRACLDFITFEENSQKFQYKMPQRDLVGWVNPRDNAAAKGHKTYGYGLLYTPDGTKFMDMVKPVWTQKELENMFVDSCNRRGAEVMQWAKSNGVQLGQNQFNALVSAVYNYGKGFFTKAGKTVCSLIAQNPNNPNIPNVWAALKANPNRRKREAALYARDISHQGGGYSGVR